MARLLIINHKSPFPVECGNTLRIYNLSRELSKKHICFAAFFKDGNVSLKNDEHNEDKVFTKSWALPTSSSNDTRKRFLHPREGHMAKRFNPEFWRQTKQILAAIIDQENIDAVFVTSGMAEYLEGVEVGAKVIDICDSNTLTLERQYSSESFSGLLDWLRKKLYLARAYHEERNVTDKYDAVTTVSPVDQRRLEQLNRRKDNLVLVPNGVNVYPATETGHSSERAIIFWGALDFPPNYTALRFFLAEAWPIIAPKKVCCYIVGKNAPEWLQKAANENGNIVLTGFVEDLYGFASRIPVMINPMQIGSGLKNKVLEAFALQRAVVSTALGMEAVQALPGEHYLQAETGKEFANSILELLDNPDRLIGMGMAARKLVLEKYTWEKAALPLNKIFEELER